MSLKIKILIISVILFSQGLKKTDYCAAYFSSRLQGEERWTRYLARGEEFSVALPEAPSVALKIRPDKRISSRYEGRIYGAYGDGVVYVIISENNPKRAEKLDNFIKEFKESLPRHRTLGSSEMLLERELSVNNFSGRRYRLNFYDGTKGVVDFYLTNQHVYIVEAAGVDESSPSIKQFLSSFSLAGNVPEKNEPAGVASKTISNLPTPPINTNLQDERIFNSKEVTRKAFVISRPEPFYTEEARQRDITGTVVLRALLSSSGKVANIKVIQELKYGLTEKAVEGATKLKFIPAIKDGKFVSQYIQIEYNFSLY